MHRGYIKLWRKIVEWEWYDCPNTSRVFFHLLLCANHTSKNWRGFIIKRGDYLTSINSLSIKLKLSTQKIRSAINRLKSTNEITCHSTSQHTIITLCNYEFYNDLENPINTPTNTQANKRATNEQQTSNKRVTTTKNDNNEKKEKKEKYKYIVDYLNEKCKTNYKSSTQKTQTLINARIKEGFSLDDFKIVIGKKSKDWLDSEMEKYLRPETLFGTKFESYLNESKNNFKGKTEWV